MTELFTKVSYTCLQLICISYLSLLLAPTPCCGKHFASMYEKEGKKDETDCNVSEYCPATLTTILCQLN